MYSFKTTTTSVHWFMRTNNNFGQFTFKKIRGKNLLTFGELTERKIHNLHSRTVNIHSRSDDNTCTAPHSHTTILNRETNSYKYVTVIVKSPAVLRLLRIFPSWLCPIPRPTVQVESRYFTYILFCDSFTLE